MNRIRTCLYLLRRELRTILSDEGTLLVLLARLVPEPFSGFRDRYDQISLVLL